MMRLLTASLFLLLAGAAFSQGEFAYLDEETETGIDMLPFPVAGGWTFTTTSPDDSLVFPVYDSIVVTPWEIETWQPFIALRDGRYGLLEYTDHLDTLEPFIYDSLFYKGFHYFGRSNGSWSRWIYLEGQNPRTVLGPVERWYDDGDFLYYTVKGKTGLLSLDDGNDFPARYRYARFLFAHSFPSASMENVLERHHYYLVSDGRYFGLSDGNKEVIPLVAETIQQHTYGFCRYWQGYWKYLRLRDGLLIDPKGGDVVIYNEHNWKVYRADRKSPTLFLQSGRRFEGQYEDYFLLENDMIAVRRDSLSGLMDPSGNLRFSCRCEQLDALDDDRYRCLKDRKWHLMDGNGKTLSAGYDFIEEKLIGHDLYAVHDNQQYGIVAGSGKEVLHPEFDQIYLFAGLFVLDRDRNLAVADLSGKMLSEHVYSRFDLWNNMLVLTTDNNEFTLYNASGKLNSKPCRQYFYVDGVLKCYAPQQLEMIVLEKGQVSERLIYPGISSFEVGDYENFQVNNYVRSAGVRSHLEEHQQSGYFGYRLDWSHGHVAKPSFREVQTWSEFGYHFGIETYEKQPFRINDSVSLTSYFALQAVDPGNARYVGNPFVSSTLREDVPGGSLSTNRMTYFGDGTQQWWISQNHAHPAGEVVYIDYPAQDVYRYNTGGALVRAGTERESFSFFDQYGRFNSSLNLAPDPASIGSVMEPANRLAVKGGKWYVDEDNSDRKVSLSSPLRGREYETIGFYDDYDYKLSTYFARSRGSATCNWSFQFGDSAVLSRFREIEADNEHYYIVTDGAIRTGLVHPFRPDFLFVPGDTTLEYAGGMLIFRENTRFGLRSVEGEERIPAAFDRITYLGHGLFGVQDGSEWIIADRSGKSDDALYTSVKPFQNGYAIVSDRNGFRVLDVARNVVFASAGRIEASGNGTFTVQAGTGKLVFDPVTAVSDTIRAEERDLGNGWVFGQTGEKRYVRRIATQERIAVLAPVIPEPFGNALVWKEKSAYRMIGPNGEPVVTKKMALTDIEKGEGVWCFKSKKQWVFVSDAGTILLDMPKGKNLMWYDGTFTIEQSDTLFAIDRYGNRYTLTEGGLEPVDGSIAVKDSPKYVVFSENGKQGLRSATGELLVGAAHPSIPGVQGEAFIVEINPGKGVYTHGLKEVVPPVYDDVIPLNAELFLVRSGGRYGIYSISGSWVRPLEAR